MNQPFERQKRRTMLTAVTLPAVLAYLLSVAGWYLSPAISWILPIASMGFPYAWIFVFILYRLWLKSHIGVAYFLLAIVLAGLQPAAATFSVGWQKEMLEKKPNDALRIMQWNSNDLPGYDIGWPENKLLKNRKKAVDFLHRFQPDIICIQDFSDVIDRRMYSNISLMADTLGYQFFHLAQYGFTIKKYGKISSYSGIFSRQPPVNKGVHRYTNSAFPEAIVWADFLLNGRLVRVVSTHFQSMHFSSQTHFAGFQLPYWQKPDSAIIMSPSILLKLKHYQQQHLLQAKQVRAFLDTCSVPVVFAADLNTVPSNYIYRLVKGDLNDGFIGSKTGLGATYNYLAPNLRIDYLLNDKQLTPQVWKHFQEGFLDHDHLLADYQWAKND
jgi:endonuclease/exonuclease/phosphatase family metal-dependent hydrolase